jgi:hypothetical protein
LGTCAATASLFYKTQIVLAFPNLQAIKKTLQEGPKKYEAVYIV